MLRSSLSVASRGGAKETEPLIETNNHPCRNLGLIIHANAPEERPLDFTFPLIDFAFDFDCVLINYIWFRNFSFNSSVRVFTDPLVPSGGGGEPHQ